MITSQEPLLVLFSTIIFSVYCMYNVGKKKNYTHCSLSDIITLVFSSSESGMHLMNM